MPARISFIGLNWHTMDEDDIEIGRQKIVRLRVPCKLYVDCSVTHSSQPHNLLGRSIRDFPLQSQTYSVAVLPLSHRNLCVRDCAFQQDVEVSVCLSGLWPRAWCICRPARPTYVHRSAFPSSLLPKTQTASPASTRLSSRSGVPRVSLPLFSGLL